jgi:signal peptidase I
VNPLRAPLPPELDATRSASPADVVLELEPGSTAFSDARPAVFPSADAPRPRAWSWLSLVAQAAAVLGFAYLCLFNLSVVRGSSMAPRIHDGDRILIDHLSYVFGEVARGDIVVLKYPLDPSVDYIKRVIGLPGDEVALERGAVWVNGERLDEPYVADQDPLSRTHIVVKPAHFFVLGDNRPRSCDSREFGLVPRDYIRGRVEVCVWPPSRVGAIDVE